MPDFIALLRDIRDRMYPEIVIAYNSFIGATVGSTTNIDPIDGVVQPATATFNPETGEFDFGIPTSPIVDNTNASLIRADGTVTMDTGYVPTLAKDVTTKEYIDGVAYGWVLKADLLNVPSITNVWGDGLFIVSAKAHEASVTAGQTSFMIAVNQNVYTSSNIFPNISGQGEYIEYDTTGDFNSKEVSFTDGVRTTGQNMDSVYKWEKL